MVKRHHRIVWAVIILVVSVGLAWYSGLFNQLGRLVGKKQSLSSTLQPAVVEVDVPLAVSPYVQYQPLLDALYQNVSGYRIAEEEKQSIRCEGGDPTYGEILYESAQVLLEDLQLTPQDVFYDLGSGAGKLIAQVYLTTPVKKAAGIELSPSRCNMAQTRAPYLRKIAEVTTRFNCDITAAINQKPVQQTRCLPSKELIFSQENMLKADLSDATVVFMCSTCFSDELMHNITNKLAGLKEGLRVITLKDLPPHKDFKLVRNYQLPMSWSKSSAGSPVYVYKLERQSSMPHMYDTEK